MMKTLIIFCTIFSVTALFLYFSQVKYAQALENIDTPVVVELFTSQGCSSCPPADKVFEELTKQKNVIALSCHVSYWNHLNWKDTLSHDFCDMRQHGILGAHGTRNIYTPQMVVNGKHIFIGSRKNELTAALKAEKQSHILNIALKKSDQSIVLSLPETQSDNYNLWGFGYKNKVTTNIGRGENSGRTIDYTNAAMTYHNLGLWDGKGETRSFEAPREDIDGIVIFAQKGGYAEIIAAGDLKL